MSKGNLSDPEATALWREAERRLRLVDLDPPVAMRRVDALLEALGPRQPDESLEAWLKRGQAGGGAAPASAEVIHVDFGRRRFRPVTEIVRLAADTAGPETELPARDLETADGRFRLRVAKEADQVVIAVQALGLASDDFAGKLVAIAAAGHEATPVAVVELDQDGDGETRVPDSPALRQALLRPVLGVLEEI